MGWQRAEKIINAPEESLVHQMLVSLNSAMMSEGLNHRRRGERQPLIETQEDELSEEDYTALIDDKNVKFKSQKKAESERYHPTSNLCMVLAAPFSLSLY